MISCDQLGKQAAVGGALGAIPGATTAQRTGSGIGHAAQHLFGGGQAKPQLPAAKPPQTPAGNVQPLYPTASGGPQGQLHSLLQRPVMPHNQTVPVEHPLGQQGQLGSGLMML